MFRNTLPETDVPTDATLACAVEIFSAFEKMTALNLQAIITALREQHSLLGAMITAPSVADAIGIQSLHLQTTSQKVHVYWRRVEEITVETFIGLFVPIRGAFTDPGNRARRGLSLALDLQ
ncbi:phasin family protein (plasmid) [Paraburkholderia sp. D15]|uniref:phasin family protein n=1 Tax=Paraburkholderia sp. D15 TaxID=2880218 RepID=UPI0024795A28|nr:phasin family protein [Paraburkholderia sp. D15]WGS55192.1 phasin family protein [Paraburkholderia sp. D15]